MITFWTFFLVLEVVAQNLWLSVQVLLVSVPVVVEISVVEMLA